MVTNHESYVHPLSLIYKLGLLLEDLAISMKIEVSGQGEVLDWGAVGLR